MMFSLRCCLYSKRTAGNSRFCGTSNRQQWDVSIERSERQSIMASDPSTPSVKPLRLDIPEQAIHQVSKFLDRITNSDIPDRLILALVWSVVQGTLSKYPEISGVIVNQEEFNDNVNRQGEKEFLELVRDSSRRRDLLHSGMFPSLTASPFFITSIQTFF